MTRVEKYREYRKEILNSFYNEKKNTKKQQSSELVSKATLNRDSNNSLSYDDVLEAYRIYDDSSTETKKEKTKRFKKQHRAFLFGGLAVILALAICLVIIGINLFGGL